jgi:hypothetical protein
MSEILRECQMRYHVWMTLIDPPAPDDPVFDPNWEDYCRCGLLQLRDYFAMMQAAG